MDALAKGWYSELCDQLWPGMYIPSSEVRDIDPENGHQDRQWVSLWRRFFTKSKPSFRCVILSPIRSALLCTYDHFTAETWDHGDTILWKDVVSWWNHPTYGEGRIFLSRDARFPSSLLPSQSQKGLCGGRRWWCHSVPTGHAPPTRGNFPLWVGWASDRVLKEIFPAIPTRIWRSTRYDLDLRWRQVFVRVQRLLWCHHYGLFRSYW